jgi:peptidase M28-like protein
MRIVSYWRVACVIFISAGCAVAQKGNVLASPDAAISQALRQVSAQRVEADINKLVRFGTRSSISAQDTASLASGRGIGAAREWLKNEYESYSRDCGGCLEVQNDTFTAAAGERIPKPTEMTNVYAVLKGADPRSANRIVLVTGHYDSRNSEIEDVEGAAPGANDDASGTAVSLECARVLSKLKFPATIIFLAVAGEEQGLIGSHHFAEMAKSQGWDIEAVLNNDIVGGDRSSQQDVSLIRVFSEGLPVTASDAQTRLIRALGAENDSPSRELARYIAETGQTYDTGIHPMMIFRPDRYLRGGDHSSFNQQGYAAIRFTEYREDYNHQHQNVRSENGVQYGDLPQYVNFDYVAGVARLNAAVLASLASAPAPPANVRLQTKQLENSSTLVWDASPDGRAEGYEVLERATTASEWEKVAAVEKGTSIALPESKDNVIFALRAADNEGHRSLPVVPTPER